MLFKRIASECIFQLAYISESECLFNNFWGFPFLNVSSTVVFWLTASAYSFYVIHQLLSINVSDMHFCNKVVLDRRHKTTALQLLTLSSGSSLGGMDLRCLSRTLMIKCQSVIPLSVPV